MGEASQLARRVLGAAGEVWAAAARRPVETATCPSIGVILVILALALQPALMGDGVFYFAMLKALAHTASPALSAALQTEMARLTGPLSPDLLITGSDGRLYAVHFFAYSLLCVPAYLALALAHADTLKAFQLTNALAVAATLSYVLVLARLSAPARWLIAAGFLLSTGTIYLQWTHPEAVTACLVLIASVAFVEQRYRLAILAAALGSLQNPSIALFILLILGAEAWRLARAGADKKDAARTLAASAAIAAIALLPYLWNYLRFGVANPIVARGYVDLANVSLERLLSFIFDLNQGLIVGLPLLIWLVPAALILRGIDAARGHGNWLHAEDLLLAAFLLMVLPTLGQGNWSAGHSVFLRYGAWAGMAPLVWGAATLGEEPDRRQLAIAMVPAASLQLMMALYIGGLSLARLPSSLGFMPWVPPIWNAFPHAYNPVPDIFYEGLVGREDSSETLPAILRGERGEIIRILTEAGSLQAAARGVCGANAGFLAADRRISSRPRMRRTEQGLWYVTGRFDCRPLAPLAAFSLAQGAGNGPRASTGWSDAERNGRWSSGPGASLGLPVRVPADGIVVLRFVGDAFVDERHPRQSVTVNVAGKAVESWTIDYPQSEFDRQIPVDAAGLADSDEIRVEFEFPDAASPRALGLSDDGRTLALFLREVRVLTLR